MDSPEELVWRHSLFKDLVAEDTAVHPEARARLGTVDEILASMVDGTKSDRAAVSILLVAEGSSIECAFCCSCPLIVFVKRLEGIDDR